MVRAKPGAQDQGVQTHLEQLDQVLTGQALAVRRASSKARLQLRLADAVLGAQTLLLLQTNGVVGVLCDGGCGRAHRGRRGGFSK